MKKSSSGAKISDLSYLCSVVKKVLSISILLSALAIMLGHNLIVHHHHETGEELHPITHHHSESPDKKDAGDDWNHLFSNFFHGENGIEYVKNTGLGQANYKQFYPLPAVLPQIIYGQNSTVVVRQNSPPYTAVYYLSFYFLFSGLRGPPSFIS